MTGVSLTEKIIFYALVAFGFWYIVGRSVASRGIRERLFHTGNWLLQLFVTLLECPACFGFWTGLVGGYATSRNWRTTIAGACLICATNLIWFHVTGLDAEKE